MDDMKHQDIESISVAASKIGEDISSPVKCDIKNATVVGSGAKYYSIELDNGIVVLLSIVQKTGRE